MAAWVSAAGAAQLELTHAPLDLPGAPAQITPVNLDGDPILELAVVVVYTAWEELAVEETSEIDDVEGLVAMMTIVPALLENRELWVFDRQGDGSWLPLAEPLELATEMQSIESTSHPKIPLLAVTDRGCEAITWSGDEGLTRQPLIAATTMLAGSGAFLPRLSWSHDLDGDRWPDLLLPVVGGWQIHRGTADGLSSEPAQTLATPSFERTVTPWRLDLPIPEVRDVDGDGRADVLLRHPIYGWRRFFLHRNLGGGRLSDPIGPLGESESPNPEDDAGPRIVLFDDVDGDGRAEYVSQEEAELEDDAGVRKEMAHAKRPPHRYRLYDAGASWRPAGEPRREFETAGYSFPGASEVRLPGGLWDLDGDGRRDLVTLTLDFSVLQAARVFVARSLKIGLDFHVLCQREDGSFLPVSGLDLSGEFRLDLNNFRQGQLSMFGGDFDGDGRRDFVQIGRGKEVTIHRGAPGCRFPSTPDLQLSLVEAPRDLALVDVLDLDGDRLSDLVVVQPKSRERAIESAAVRLDLYLSGEPR